MKRRTAVPLRLVIGCLCAVALPGAGVAQELVLDIDIKPGNETNTLQVRKPAPVPVAIHHGGRAIDLGSLLLEGVPAIDWVYEEGRLVAKFDSEAVLEAFGTVHDGDMITLTLAGALKDGTPFVGYDEAFIVKRTP